MGLSEPAPATALQFAQYAGLVAMVLLLAPQVIPAVRRHLPRRWGVTLIATYVAAALAGALWLGMR
jgi:hypothetical protein